MNLAGDDVMILLGAGASRDAGLKTSIDMVRDLEARLGGDSGWSDFASLYNCVKSCILYADGVRGDFNTGDAFNIERLVNALDELSRNQEHTIYPFVAAWNMELLRHGDPTFARVRELRTKIVAQLVSDWVHLQNYDSADYYEGIIKLQRAWGTPLHVFSLNYDMCVERVCRTHACNVNRGFEKSEDGETVWNWLQMEDEERSVDPIYLYKMHGSLDWRRTKNGELIALDEPKPGDSVDDYQLIFGTSYKLRYDDPFLYFVYCLRRFAIEAKVIVSVGYSLQDDHVNKILERAMHAGVQKKHFVHVTWLSCDPDEASLRSERDRVAATLGVAPDQVTVMGRGARSFLSQELTREMLEKAIGAEETPF